MTVSGCLRSLFVHIRDSESFTSETHTHYKIYVYPRYRVLVADRACRLYMQTVIKKWIALYQITWQTTLISHSVHIPLQWR